MAGAPATEVAATGTPKTPEAVTPEPETPESETPEPLVAEPVTAEAAPVEAAPVEAAPVEAAPVETAPIEAAPISETPVAETLVAETLVAEAPDAEADEAEEAAPRVTFADLGLSEPIFHAVADAGYIHPTPIQEQAIPVVLQGRDVLGCAQTGTGKTASFVLPMLDILAGSRAKARMPRSLILEPTRELALQVAENFVKYGKHLKLVHALLIGGESMDEQKAVLNAGVDVLIATPGRLLDLFERGRILLADCKVLVIDEADRMLDMGFIPDVERIVSLLPPLRQTLFFSATMAPEIRRLADAFLRNPREITVSRPASVATTITAGVVWVRETEKREALRRLLKGEVVQNALIFCNRKVEVDILYKSLKRHGFSVGALHGDMEQSARFATLNKFKNNELQLLVCSDVAARGLDIGGLSHVFNFDVPFHAEDYVHRIGRTGRAGREGRAYSIAGPGDAKNIAAIEKLTGAPIPTLVIEGIEAPSEEEMAAARERRGGRGGRDAAPARGAAAGRGREGAREAGRGRGGERAARPAPREAVAAAEEPAREERPRAEERVREERPRRAPRAEAAERAPAAEAPQVAEPRHRRDEPRRDEPRRDEDSPRARPPRDDARSRDERRRQDDLGPSVLGFGDSTPAFMLIPTPKPRRSAEPDAPNGSAQAA
ncbi:DEAD/DEAH box helicase [Humitalea rosea]|uniref:DEAD/DEAH box helicase n=1 Tax=Humitalea rosea TaxID=990373 RepID=UPI0038D11A52